jgi:RNA recognition motif-containing protein
MAMKLYVGGLAYSVTEQELEQTFAAEGKVVSAVVIKDRDSGQSKGFGFVEMEDVKEGQNAIKNLDGKERRPRSGGGGGYSGGGGGGYRGGGGGGGNSRRQY